MSKLTIMLVAIFLIFAGYALFTLRATDELGSFDSVRAAGEINQSVNVRVDHDKGFERDRNNNITVFYARDIKNGEAKVSLDEPAPPEIMTADIVEIFGHMHGNSFIAKRVSIVKPAE